MNGDEDLGQDIIMKGEKFHYNQEPVNAVRLQLDGAPGNVVEPKEEKKPELKNDD